MDARALLPSPCLEELRRRITVCSVVAGVEFVDGRLVLCFKAGSVKRLVLGGAVLETAIAQLGADTDAWPGQAISLEV